MDRRSREEQTDALLSALHITGKVDGVVIASIRSELTILRQLAEAADSYRQGANVTESGHNLDFALDIWKGYRSALGDPICRSCGRTFTPSHDVSAEGPDVATPVHACVVDQPIIGFKTEGQVRWSACPISTTTSSPGAAPSVMASWCGLSWSRPTRTRAAGAA